MIHNADDEHEENATMTNAVDEKGFVCLKLIKRGSFTILYVTFLCVYYIL